MFDGPVPVTRVLGLALVAFAGLLEGCNQTPREVIALNAGADALIAGRREEALGHYDEAIKAKPDWATAHCSKGSALMQLKRYADAVESFRECARLERNGTEGKALLAEALVRSCRYVEAAAALAASDRTKTKDPRILHNGEWVHHQLAKAATLGGRCLPDNE